MYTVLTVWLAAAEVGAVCLVVDAAEREVTLNTHTRNTQYFISVQ